MSVKWIEDVDSGELFPVVEDENFDIPEHLKDADYNEVDYDKTTKYTIEQLQNKLIAAENQINEIKSDTHANVVSEHLDELPSKTAEISKSHFDWLGSLKFVSVVIGLAAVISLSLGGLKILSDEGIIELRTNENLQSVSETNSKVSISPVPVYGKIPAFTDGNGMYYYIDGDNSSDSKTDTSDTDTAEDDETETENNPLLNWAFRFDAVIISIFVLRLVIKFMMNTLRSV